MSPSTLSRYENGRRELLLEDLTRIAEVLQVPTTLLVVDGDDHASDDNFVPSTQESTQEFPQDASADPELTAMLEQHLHDMLRRLRQLDPDKPMKEQSIYRVAVALTTFSRVMWEIVAALQAQAQQERILLQQALEQQTNEEPMP